MDLFFSSIWTYGGAFLLSITVIVFFHELGHFLTARLNGANACERAEDVRRRFGETVP